MKRNIVWHIGVIDDDNAAQVALATVFQDRGDVQLHISRYAGDLPEIIRPDADGNCQVDVLLLDIRLPHNSREAKLHTPDRLPPRGCTLALSLAHNDHTRHLPFFAYTQYADDPAVASALNDILACPNRLATFDVRPDVNEVLDQWVTGWLDHTRYVVTWARGNAAIVVERLTRLTPLSTGDVYLNGVSPSHLVDDGPNRQQLWFDSGAIYPHAPLRNYLVIRDEGERDFVWEVPQKPVGW